MLKFCNITINYLMNYKKKKLTQHHCTPRDELHESHHRSPLSPQLLHSPTHHPEDMKQQKILGALSVSMIHFRVPYSHTKKCFIIQHRQKYLMQLNSTQNQNLNQVPPKYSKCYTNQIKQFKIITNYNYSNITKFHTNYMNFCTFLHGLHFDNYHFSPPTQCAWVIC